MTTRKNIAILSLAVAGIAAIAAYVVFAGNSGVVAVQTGYAARQNLTQTVSANGEIRPKKFVNISSNAMGRIVSMPVKEGDSVSEGDLLIRLESIQTEADVWAAEAALEAARTELEGMAAQFQSAEAAVRSARADIARAEADLQRTVQNLQRANLLTVEGLISSEQLDRIQTEHDIASAQLHSANARVAQAEAQAAQVLKQQEGTTLRLSQQRSALIRAQDQLARTTIVSPLAGVITYLPVNEGEMAIVGVQNQPGTVLMTIADLSVITAEVSVDETDIVNVRVGQEAEIRVDALRDRVLRGYVSEVGNSALTRTGGLTSAASGGAAEAKDFKVVITLNEPPPELRPGLSCTVIIATATSGQALTVPIQALTIREFDQLDDAANGAQKVPREGVFAIRGGAAFFVPVRTGVTGATDIEILEGLNEGDEIVTGPYQALRTLQDDTKIRIEPAP